MALTHVALGPGCFEALPAPPTFRFQVLRIVLQREMRLVCVLTLRVDRFSSVGRRGWRQDHHFVGCGLEIVLDFGLVWFLLNREYMIWSGLYLPHIFRSAKRCFALFSDSELKEAFTAFKDKSEISLHLGEWRFLPTQFQLNCSNDS